MEIGDNWLFRMAAQSDHCRALGEAACQAPCKFNVVFDTCHLDFVDFVGLKVHEWASWGFTGADLLADTQLDLDENLIVNTMTPSTWFRNETYRFSRSAVMCASFLSPTSGSDPSCTGACEWTEYGWCRPSAVEWDDEEFKNLAPKLDKCASACACRQNTTASNSTSAAATSTADGSENQDMSHACPLSALPALFLSVVLSGWLPLRVYPTPHAQPRLPADRSQ